MTDAAAAPPQAAPPSTPALTRGDLAIFFGAALLLATANLGGTTLAPLDDCFYAVKAREMAAHPGMTVTWAGRPAFQNPPGQIWLLAASLGALGANDFAARLPGALMTVGVLAATAWIGARLLSPLAGLGGAALLAISPLFLNNARRVMLETPTLFWVTLAVAATVAWRRRPWAILLLAPAVAMAALTKSVLGLEALLIPVAAAVVLPEWRPLLRDGRFGIAALVGLAVGASWSLHQWRAFGAEFTGVHFAREIAGRSTESIGIAKRILGYPAILLAQFQPVVLLAIPGVRAMLLRRRATRLAPEIGVHSGFEGARLLLIWGALPLAIALASAAQSAHYVYAIFPALALLAAAWLAERWPRACRRAATRLVPALMLAGALIFWIRPEMLTRDANRAYRDAAPALAARAPAGAEIAFLGNDYWRAANPLLWYDRLRLAASAPSAAEAVAQARAGSGLLLVERARLAELPPETRNARRWIDARDAVLLELAPGAQAVSGVTGYSSRNSGRFWMSARSGSRRDHTASR